MIQRRSKTGLLPCPFCSSTELSRMTIPAKDDKPEVVFLQCDHCGATGPIADSEIETRALWDVRAEQA